MCLALLNKSKKLTSSSLTCRLWVFLCGFSISRLDIMVVVLSPILIFLGWEGR